MRRLLSGVALLAWLAGGSAALAIDPVGSPTATVAEGEAYIGIERSYSARDVDIDLEVLGTKISKAGELQRTALTVVLGAGVVEGTEVFLRLGGSSSEMENALGTVSDFDAEGDAAFTLGGGVRVTLFEPVEDVRIGVTTQLHYHQLEDGTLEMGVRDQDLQAEILDITAALGVTVDMEPLTVHAGLLASWMVADTDYDFIDQGVPRPADVDIDEDSNLGCFLGGSLTLMENVSLTLNGHLMTDGWGVGGAVVIKL